MFILTKLFKQHINSVLVFVSYHECHQDEDQSALQVGVIVLFCSTVWIVDYVQNQFLLSTHTHGKAETGIKLAFESLWNL